jgi:hypothetical protein
MEQQTVTHECIVHKAALPIADGESLNQYTRKLNEAAQKWLTQKLNLTTAKCSVYMIEAYSDAAVFDVYKRGDNPDQAGTYSYYAVEYSRKDSGEFEFSASQEVERVISFQPKAKLTTATTSKSKKGIADDAEEAAEEADEEQEDLAKKPSKGKAKKTQKEWRPGWAPTLKALWAGVV